MVSVSGESTSDRQPKSTECQSAEHQGRQEQHRLASALSALVSVETRPAEVNSLSPQDHQRGTQRSLWAEPSRLSKASCVSVDIERLIRTVFRALWFRWLRRFRSRLRLDGRLRRWMGSRRLPSRKDRLWLGERLAAWRSICRVIESWSGHHQPFPGRGAIPGSRGAFCFRRSAASGKRRVTPKEMNVAAAAEDWL